MMISSIIILFKVKYKVYKNWKGESERWKISKTEEWLVAHLRCRSFEACN